MNIEIELRALIDEEKFNELNELLPKKGEFKGDDNKDTYFYIYPTKLLKVTDSYSGKGAKVSLKTNRIGNGSGFGEYEFQIPKEEVANANELFSAFDAEKIMYTFQFRKNYVYKGVELAIKYTHNWGFHLEMEVLVQDDKDKESAEEMMHDVADELGIHILTEGELQVLENKLLDDYIRGEYTKEEFAKKYLKG